jgi:hypothetical protein
MELKLQVGVDRIVLSNLWITHIDGEVLEKAIAENPENTIKIIDTGQPYWPDKGMLFSKLEIIDNNVFGSLRVGVGNKLNTQGYGNRYGIMDVTIRGPYDNLQNMSVPDLQKNIQKIEQYVAENYGVYLSFNDASIHTIEINVTIPYVPVTSVYPLLENVLINLKIGGERYAANGTIKKRGTEPLTKYVDITTISRKNKSKELVFYDKTEQLKNVRGIYLSEPLLRIELKLNSSQAIRYRLGHSKLWRLNQEQLSRIFYKDVVEKIEQYQLSYKTKEKKNAKALLAKYRPAGNKSKNHNWPILMLTEISQSFAEGDVKLLDISIFKDVCKEVIGSKHGNDVYKRIVACCNQYTPIINSGYDQKLDLLVNTLQKAVKGDETCLVEKLKK